MIAMGIKYSLGAAYISAALTYRTFHSIGALLIMLNVAKFKTRTLGSL